VNAEARYICVQSRTLLERIDIDGARNIRAAVHTESVS
jgi:hypothetical protein